MDDVIPVGAFVVGDVEAGGAGDACPGRGHHSARQADQRGRECGVRAVHRVAQAGAPVPRLER
jgi:hypothetical protein